MGKTSRVEVVNTGGSSWTSRVGMLVGQVRHQEWKVVNARETCGTSSTEMLAEQVKHQEWKVVNAR